jgi:hypothetical protein
VDNLDTHVLQMLRRTEADNCSNCGDPYAPPDTMTSMRALLICCPAAV